MRNQLLIRDLDEAGLLARIVPLLPVGLGVELGPGDDAAVVRAPDGRYVTTCDVLVEDRHFKRDWSSGYDVGWRAAMQNLADVAAMGATPTALVVGLALPGDLPVSWAEDFARGLAAACATCGASVVGGDLSSADSIFVSITAMGDLASRAPVTRAGARPGDVVAHAGVLGHSAAGLAILNQVGTAVERHEREPYLDGYLRPNPPLPGGVAAAKAGASAMMDVSDGLLIDAGRMANASNVVIELGALTPVAPPVETTNKLAAAVAELQPTALALGLSRVDAQNWALTGGEDHGLLATFPPGVELPPGFEPIGTVRALTEGQAPTVTVDGQTPNQTLGWDHFAAQGGPQSD